MSAYESVDGLDIEFRDGVLTLRLARPGEAQRARTTR